MNANTNKGYYYIIKCYKWYIVSIITFSLLLTSIYLYYTPNIYKSYSIIEVKDDNTHIGGNDILLSALTGYSSSGVDKDIEILKTYELNKKILDKIDFNDNKNSLDKEDIYNNIITKNLHISKVRKNVPLIKIEFFDTNPKRATDYVNILAKTYISQNIKTKSEQNNKIIKFINKELNTIKDRLKKSETKLKKYQESKKVINPSAQSNALIHKLSDIEVRLANNRLRKELISNINLMEFNSNITSIAPILRALDEKPTLGLISKLQDSQIKLKELSVEYTYKHPKVVETLNKIEMLKRKINSNIKNLKWSINRENRNINALKYKYNQELKTFPAKEKYLINMKRDYEVNAKTYKYLLEKKSENEIIKVAIIADYKVIEKGYIPKKPVRPKKISFLLVSFISSLLFSIFLILTINKFSKSIKREEDIKLNGRIKFCYTIPSFIKNRELFIDSCKKIASRLQLIPNINSYSKIVIISSIEDNQGKTLLSSKLAEVFKDMQDKTIIIDFNINRPNIHNIFELDNSVGLGTYLSGGHKLYEVIKPTIYKDLDVITMGLRPPNPSKLIFSERFTQLLNELKKEYSHIVIDTASINSSYETLNLMKYADINLFVFKINLSKKESLNDLNIFAKEFDIKNIGIILNRYN